MLSFVRKTYRALILDHPFIATLMMLALVAFFVLQLPNIKLEASADALVLEDDQSLRYFRDTYKRYGSGSFLIVTYTAKQDLLSDESLSHISLLKEEFEKIEGVDNVFSILDVPLLYSPKLGFSDLGGELKTVLTPGVDKKLVKHEFTHSPIYKDLIMSADGQTTALLLNLTKDEKSSRLSDQREELRNKRYDQGLTKEEQLELDRISSEYKNYSPVAQAEAAQTLQQVRDVVDQHRDRAGMFVGGVTMIASDMVTFIRSDLVLFGAGIAIFMLITLIVIFRKLRWVLLPVLTCVVTVTLVLGYLALVDWRMTVISSNFVALLLIITLSITIHLIVRYRELAMADSNATAKELIESTVRFMAVPCFYMVLTTAVAFISLIVSGIRPVIDFGWMMTFGIVVAFLVVFVVLPVGLSFLPREKMREGVNYDAPFTLVFARFTEKHGGKVGLLSLLLAAVSVYGVSQLEVENRFIDYFDEDTEIYQGMSLIDRKLGGTVPLDIILNVDPEKAPDTTIIEDDPFAEEDPFASDEEEQVKPSYWFSRAGLQQVEAIHDYMESLTETGKVQSVATAYKIAKDLTGEDLDNFQLSFLRTALPEKVDEVLVAPYFDDELDQVRISARVMETDPNLKRNEFLKNLRPYLVENFNLKPEQIELTGMLVLYNNMLQSLYKSQILTLGAVFIGIVLMFLVLFRSLKIALLSIVPTLLAAGAVLGGMGIVGIPLDMMTITIAAIVVGIGVDNTIHYIHRFRKEFVKDRDYLATMYRCHGSIGRAMYYTSLTIIVGFSILALSNFVPSVYFGLLTSFAMLIALLGALVLLPQLLLVFKPFGR